MTPPRRPGLNTDDVEERPAAAQRAGSSLGSGRVEVRPAVVGDVPFAAALHRATLPHGFFAQLGVGFLQTYYRSFLRSPHAVALVAVADGEPLGVLVGTVRNRAHYAWVGRHEGPRLALAGAAALALRPSLAAGFLRRRAGRYLRAWKRVARHPVRGSPGTPHPPERDLAVLTHVSISPTARGRGLGAALVDAFTATARERGAIEAHLVTLSGPEGAGGFYARHGWRYEGEGRTADGAPVGRWSLDLSELS
jgi:ribosomal protein S18 acetylase RimI-like enzyme